MAIKKIYLLPNLLTALALTCGLFVIFKMNMTEIGAVDEQILKATAGLLLVAGLLDLMDGAVARAMRAESEFGGVFDCMADSISFGVAPAVIILKSMSLESGTTESFLMTTSAILYSVCGVMRLVRFNVTSKKIQGDQELILADQKNFTGLPIPAAAAAAISLNLVLFTPAFQNMVALSERGRVIVLFTALIFLGYFMISRWKFPSVKRLRIRVASFRVVFLMVLLAVLIFYGFLHQFAFVFASLAWSYILIAGIFSLARVVAGRRNKALEDFEPESDDLTDEEN